MSEEVSYGWTGKILRVNLSTGEISTLSTEPYKAYMGGMGLANKIMYDEVPAGTDPLSPENKIVFAVGPLTASGVPMAGRTTISTLSCFTKGNLIVDAHCGGMIGARIKQAGWDAIIVEGKSSFPCYINVVDDRVEIKDATNVWGLGTRATNEILCRQESPRACVASIGPAGENLLPYSCIINARNHSAGAGTGAVLGSKLCKALVVEGNGGVNVADPQAVADLSDYMLREVVGSNNNWAVPSTQQEWAEYYDEGSRWTSRKGLYWADAEGHPIETGEPKPGELNTVGYRCMKSTRDFGDAAEKYTIKMNGCHSCPIHCHVDLRVNAAGEAESYAVGGNTCAPNMGWKNVDNFLKIGYKGEDAILWNMVFGNIVDDLGIWCNYCQIYRDLGYCIKNGILEKVLPPEEYASYHWEKLYNNDPTILNELMTAIASNDCELAYIAHGPIVWCERWGVTDWFDNKASKIISYLGFPIHHGAEDCAQSGAVYNTLFNRDCIVHSGSNFSRQGFPLELMRELAAEMWGSSECVDEPEHFTPMNETKAKYAWWCVVTDVLHDSLTLCNWVWPMSASPDRRRNYRGDLDLEAKFFKAVTGLDVTTDDLYKAGARIMTLHRAMTVRDMGTNDLRNEHDRITDWSFDMDPELDPFSEGTTKLDRADMETAFTMLYQQFGWDEKLGCPTAACLDDYGMADVKEDLAARGLLA